MYAPYSNIMWRSRSNILLCYLTQKSWNLPLSLVITFDTRAWLHKVSKDSRILTSKGKCPPTLSDIYIEEQNSAAKFRSQSVINFLLLDIFTSIFLLFLTINKSKRHLYIKLTFFSEWCRISNFNWLFAYFTLPLWQRKM